MVGDNRQLSKDMSARANAEDFRLAQSAHAQLTGNIAAATRSAKIKASQKEAQRIIFGITSPQTAALITPTPGLRGMMKGKYNVPGFGPVNMGYRMFGYNKGGPAAKEMGGVDSAVRSWGQSKATWLYIAKLAKLKPLSAPGYVMKALSLMPQSLKRKLRGKDVGLKSDNYHLLIFNAGRTAMAPKSRLGPGGFHAFKDAYNGRIAFFKMNMEKGAFKTLEKILKKYPGLSVS